MNFQLCPIRVLVGRKPGRPSHSVILMTKTWARNDEGRLHAPCSLGAIAEAGLAAGERRRHGNAVALDVIDAKALEAVECRLLFDEFRDGLDT